jgi:putative ATP-dependent endonuclease of OLD family
MFINKVKIINYRCYKRFSISLEQKMNIVVGDNEAGKSTILEAVNLAMTGYINGRNIRNELSQNLFNADVVREYLDALNDRRDVVPPSIVIEVFFSSFENPEDPDEEKHFREVFRGQDNTDNDRMASGFMFVISFNELYSDELQALLGSGKPISSLPIEYYDVRWLTFAGKEITTKSLPIKSALIDSSSQPAYGVDPYLNHIVRSILEPADISAVTQAHRHLRDEFRADEAIQAINQRIGENKKITDKSISLSVEMVTKNAWLSSLVTELDAIPFPFVGKGEQSIVKTELALLRRDAQRAGVILIEEPENHLSHTRLNKLIEHIAANHPEKQFIITTHSSFVANKLGLEHLHLLAEHKETTMTSLSEPTYRFFKTVAGYDTLRMILCKQAILCEGDSDELIIQRCYKQVKGRLPIEDGIEVISVGTSFLRFLEIAKKLNCRVAVVTDNDGEPEAKKKKYSDYLGDNQTENIKICIDWAVHKKEAYSGFEILPVDFNYNTLEPVMLLANGMDRLNRILGTDYSNAGGLLKHMHANKTECALKIFETEEEISFPAYIREAFT